MRRRQFALSVRRLQERAGLGRSRPQDNRTHLDAAIDWLCHAQDVAKKGGVRDDGVSQTFLMKSARWAPSYPETTGYIIPTFYRYWSLSGRDDIRRRAIRMADWECEIQHPSGGVLAGALGDSDAPTVFNTGQVLFGWARAFEMEKNEDYRTAAAKAAKWLCDQQDDDGCWRKFGSPFTSADINLYNTRSAWGLMRAWAITGEAPFRDRAIRNIEWALRQQHGNGWFPQNCLYDEKQPYTHTIAYAARGILEVGAMTGEHRYVQAARRVADAMSARMPASGRLPGRFDANWRPTVAWSCLTGIAQMSLCFARLFEIDGAAEYVPAMRRGNAFLKSAQRLSGDAAGRGGIAGSYPLDGGYHPWQYPNWAAKFFADALMLEEKIGTNAREESGVLAVPA